jgi:hypothetical protein
MLLTAAAVELGGAELEPSGGRVSACGTLEGDGCGSTEGALMTRGETVLPGGSVRSHAISVIWTAPSRTIAVSTWPQRDLVAAGSRVIGAETVGWRSRNATQLGCILAGA